MVHQPRQTADSYQTDKMAKQASTSTSNQSTTLYHHYNQNISNKNFRQKFSDQLKSSDIGKL